MTSQIISIQFFVSNLVFQQMDNQWKNRQDKWIDYLTAYGYDVNAVYHNIITRIRGDPKRLMNEMLTRTQNFMKISPAVRAYLENISPYTRIQKVIQQINNNFNLSQSHIKLLLNKYLWTNIQQDSLFDFLQSKNIKLKVRFRKGHYQLVVFVTKSMFQNFVRFGDVVNINFNFVPTKRNPLMRCHYLGLFSGINSSGDVIVFGISVIVGSNPEFRAQAILEFLQLVKPYRPYSLIGQHTEIIKLSLQNNNRMQNFRTNFYENWYFTLQKAQKQYIGQPYKKQIVNYMKKILLTFNKNDVQNMIKKINKYLTMKQNRRVVYHLLQNTMSYKCSQRPSFVGFEVQGNKTHNISQIVKSYFGYCKNLGNLIYLSLQFQKKLLRQATHPKIMKKPELLLTKYKQIQKKQELIQLCHIMSEQMYKKIFYNYILAINNCSLVQTENNPLVVIIMQHSPHKKKTNLPHTTDVDGSDHLDEYVVRFNVNYDCWECECNMIYWAGIPCSHLMHVVLHFGGSLRYYINQRWIIHNRHPNSSFQLKHRQKQNTINELYNKQLIPSDL